MQDGSLAKKPKDQGNSNTGTDPTIGNTSNDTGAQGLILEYPDYEGNRTSDFDEGWPETNLAGCHDDSSPMRCQNTTGMTSQEHELSSEEEDNLNDFDHESNPDDNGNTGQEIWENRSIASSVIFLGENRNNLDVKILVVRPERRVTSSRSSATDNNNGGQISRGSQLSGKCYTKDGEREQE